MRRNRASFGIGRHPKRRSQPLYSWHAGFQKVRATTRRQQTKQKRSSCWNIHQCIQTRADPLLSCCTFPNNIYLFILTLMLNTLLNLAISVAVGTSGATELHPSCFHNWGTKYTQLLATDTKGTFRFLKSLKVPRVSAAQRLDRSNFNTEILFIHFCVFSIGLWNFGGFHEPISFLYG